MGLANRKEAASGMTDGRIEPARIDITRQSDTEHLNAEIIAAVKCQTLLSSQICRKGTATQDPQETRDGCSDRTWLGATSPADKNFRITGTP